MSAPESVPLSGDVPFVKKRKLWPIALVAVVAIAAIAFFAIRASRARVPTRVLVAIDLDGYWWEGSESAATISDRVATHLSKLGFDVVKGGDPEATKILEKNRALRDAARKLKAGFLLEVKLAPVAHVHEEANDYVELRIDAPVMLSFGDDTPREIGRIVAYAGAPNEKDARQEIVSSVTDQLVGAAVGPMIAQPEIRDILAKRATNEAAVLAPAVAWVERRDRLVKKALEMYRTLRDERTKNERGNPKPTFLSAPDAFDELAGVGPSGWLAATKGIRPAYFAEREELGWYVELETVEWRTLDPKAPAKRVFEGYNVFGYPSAQGDAAALVEDVFGWAKAITLVADPSSKPRRIKVDPEHRYVGPVVSPGKRFIATWDRSCASCPDELLVLAVDGGATVFHVERENGSFGGFAWLDDHRLAFLHTASRDDGDAKVLPRPRTPEELEAEKKSAAAEKKPKPVDDDAITEDYAQPKPAVTALWTLDCSVTPATLGPALRVPDAVVIENPTVSPSGSVLVFHTLRGSIATLDLASGTFGSIAVPGLARWPSFSADGKRLAFELFADGASSAEIAIVDVAGGAARALTDNDAIDRRPFFTADGRTILYETTEPDPVFPKSRNVLWVASVPVP
jgi:hypothetical protein